ncbi:MAG TPA: hypothetical protein VMT64_02840 [Candidatus Binataceae bacterium]|nr:hypothetical protein [Candidatus Binataceae bacterium]
MRRIIFPITIIAIAFAIAPGAFAQDALDLPMNREGSGTAWQPDSTPMYAKGFMLDGWSMMAHGLAFGGYDYQGSRRGGGQVFSTNWAMLMAEHELLGGELGARLMMSGEEFTDGGRGYPLLLQSGEEFHGVPNHDRQHPHDLFMELAATYTRKISKDVGFELYGGPVGEPALGPVAAPHRESAAADPFAPIGHHWMDSTHVTFGVVTAGVFTRNLKLEMSWFNGREPDSNRSDFDFRRMDSYSTRLSYNPMRDLSLQVSWGYLKSPEQLEPNVSINRVTASATWNRPLASGGNWATTAGWGRNIPSSGKPNDALLLESNFDLDTRNVLFARAEFVRKTGDDLDFTPAGQLYSVGAVSLGYLRNFPILNAFIMSPGVMVTTNFIDGRLNSAYHSQTPVGLAAFIRLRPARMDMD